MSRNRSNLLETIYSDYVISATVFSNVHNNVIMCSFLVNVIKVKSADVLFHYTRVQQYGLAFRLTGEI